MSIVLRDFLYLDRQLVRNLLAQIEGAVFDEATERSTSSGKAGFSGSAGYGPLKTSGEKSKQSSTESEAVYKQVGASEFNRLMEVLEAEPLQVLEGASSPDDVQGIRRKQFLELDARLRVSGMQQILEMAKSVASIAPVLETLGENSADDGALERLKALAGLGGPDRPLGLIGTVPGSLGFQVALELRSDGVLTDSWDVEATALLKVQRVVPAGETYLVGDPFGGLLKMLPNKQRDDLVKSMSGSEMQQLGVGETQITGPALVGTPVAIYR